MSEPLQFESMEGSLPEKESQSKYASIVAAVIGLKPTHILKVNPDGAKPDEVINRIRQYVSKKGYKLKACITKEGAVLIGNVIKK